MTDDGGASSRQRQAATARAFVVNSLGAKAQSVAELEAKLAAREVPPNLAVELVQEAARLGYLDDGELARQLARGFLTRGYGRRRAALALRRRGLPDVHAEAALAAAFDGEDEAALAAAALGRRAVGDERERRRSVAYLVRRGFSTGIAWQVVRSHATDERS